MKKFGVSVRGRVKNFPLPKNQPLVPVFEAIVNSFNAIDERRKLDPTFKNPQIQIELLRDGQMVLETSGMLPDIVSFRIKDNGIGFNDENMNSFMESDSSYKEKSGGKGVGRFSWLVVFQSAHVESIYQQWGRYLKRKFTFSVDHDEIEDVHVGSMRKIVAQPLS